MKIKETINGFPKLSTAKLIDIVKEYDIVSFDIFDTLIKRDVYKEYDVFDLVEKKYNSTYGDNILNFKDIRIEAEKNARKISNKEEISLSEIYASIVKIDNKYDTKIRELLSLEEEIEYEISYQNKLIKQVYDYCVSKNKQIYIISDMYLSRNLIERMLIKNGYNTYKRLFLSSEVGLQKRTGHLFKYVLESEGIKRKAIIHIGDNKRNDWFCAKKVGISAINIAKNNTNLIYKDLGGNIDDTTIWSFINNRLPYIENRNVAIGYEVYGPVLYSFVNWLKDNIDPNKSVLFFSRDCYVVKRAYEIIALNNQNSIYFYGSRRSLLVPALYLDSSIENLCRLVKSESAQFTVYGLLKKIGLSPKDYRETLKKCSLCLDSILVRDHLAENKNFILFYNSIQNEVKQNSEKAYRGFVKYIESLKCTHDLQVVDIGWRCTMQYCLDNLLKNKNSIKGYYLGVREDAFIDKNNFLGLFLNGEDDKEKKIFLAAMTALIEIFFSALHGSVEGYDIDGNPILGEHECVNDFSSAQLIRDLHEGAIQFVEDFNGSIIKNLIDISIDEALNGIKKLGTKPQKKEIDSFGKFPFRMGVGIVNAADPKSIIGYILHPKNFLYDFSNSNWKIAFLKKMLHMNLPYYNIFKILYRHKR